jgi:hypothetical protein
LDILDGYVSTVGSIGIRYRLHIATHGSHSQSSQVTTYR